MATDEISNSAPKKPEDFASLLLSDEPLFIVGGQAVNLWALYYNERTADLQPFTSRDLDILGDSNTLNHISKLVGKKATFFPMRPPTNEVGVVVGETPAGETLPIEVLSYINGITNDELKSHSYTMGFENSDALVKVPDPIALLQAKIANVIDLPQAERQDEKHVKILVKLIPAYLNDIYLSMKNERITEREMINILEDLLTTTTSPKAFKVCATLDISLGTLFAELQPGHYQKLNSFLNKRLPQILSPLVKN